jgi:hypothetical protein
MFSQKCFGSEDYLLSTMKYFWMESEKNSEQSYSMPDESFDSPSHGGGEEPEHHSWDNIYLDPYAETVIVINPY